MGDVHKETADLLPENLEAAEAHHWPIIRAYADRIGLVELINACIDSQMEIDPGTLVLGMVLDTLSGRSPLYHLQRFFEGQDTELLLGKAVDPKVFNDDNAGRVMDKLFQYGTAQLFTKVALKAFEAFSPSSRFVHFDTTSVSVFGDYLNSEDSPLHLTHGHSKDNRPDLKQFIFSMFCIGGNVPIFGKTENGNASDKVLNNQVLSAISNHMKLFKVDPGTFIYVADSAVVTSDNLNLLDDGIFFITRLPATYGECDRVIHQTFEEDTFKEIGSLSQAKPTKSRPVANYKLSDSDVTLYDKRYRAVVVHSSSHDKRRQKRLQKEVAQSLGKMKTLLKAHKKETWFCRKDAEQALEKLKKHQTAFHDLRLTILEVPIYQRGRLKKGSVRAIKEMRYAIDAEIIEKHDAIDQKKEELGCFVLLTNVPREAEEKGLTATEVLRAYKEQHGIEKNFGFLKDDAIVNALFLKTPERIEALGLILLIALLIWRLMESEMRRHLAETGQQLHGWDNKPTSRPTSYMVTIKFKGTVIIKIGPKRYLSRMFSENQLDFLEALGLSPRIFTQNARDG